jgi:polyvinyl alcohol dehydrogenase (cytochrome)
MAWLTKLGIATAPIWMAVGANAAGGGSLWTSSGQNIANTRYQNTESKINVTNVGLLGVKWVFMTQGDVSATPVLDGARVYFPDWAGNLYAVDRKTGAQLWKASIPGLTGIPGDKARATPALSGDKIFVGTQGPFGGGGKMLAFSKDTGALLWATQLEDHPAAIITQSATVHDGRVYVGVASQEEALAALVPGYVCCTFRGSILALDEATGAILWKTYTAPDGYSGSAVWGSAPAVDTKRGQLYIATGNNYSVPADVLACVAAAQTDQAKQGCIAADDLFDSIVALDLQTGLVRWATKAIPYDAWTVDCIPFFGDGSNCPQPAGPDYDFGQAPALFTVKPAGSGKPRDLVGAGQKSGQYWALDPDTGAVVWVTQAGPGGTAGGLQWGSAVDGTRVYTANSNSNFKPWVLPDGSVTFRGVWSALDTATGQVLWQKTTPNNDANGWGDTSGPVSTANGVVFSCSVGTAGWMYALNGATGDVLWSFASGGSCLSGAAVSNGEVYWGSGYGNFGLGTSNNRLYAFDIK